MMGHLTPDVAEQRLLSYSWYRAATKQVSSLLSLCNTVCTW